jgi:hypothetical protein
MKERPLLTAAAGLLVAAPAVAVLIFVHRFGVDVPYFDEWSEMRHVIALYEGNLGLNDLVANHNEHRLVFPRLLMLALARATNYNLRAFMFASVILLLATTGLLLFVHLRAQRARNRSALFALLTFLPVACLMLTFRQVDNFLFGIQIAVFSSLFFFVLAMILLDSSQGLDLRFFAAIVAAMMSSFSFACGLLAFPVGLIQLFLQRRSVREKTVWLLIGVAVWMVYAISFKGVALISEYAFVLRHPVSALLQLMAFTGNPIATEIYPALASGMIILLLYMAVTAHLVVRNAGQSGGHTSVMLSLVLFTVFCGVMIVFGRAQFGAQAGLAPRYVSLAAPGVSGLYMMLLALDASRLRTSLLGMTVGIIIPGILTSFPQGYAGGRFWNAERRASRHYLVTYRQQPDEHLTTLFIQVDMVRQRAADLERHQLSVFRGGARAGPQPSPSQTQFKIETIDGKRIENDSSVTVDGTREAIIDGWATDSPSRKTAAGVFLVIDGTLEVPAKYGLARNKTAELSGFDRYFFAGFSARIPPSTLAPGTHRLGLKIFTADDRSFYLTPEIPLLVE